MGKAPVRLTPQWEREATRTMGGMDSMHEELWRKHTDSAIVTHFAGNRIEHQRAVGNFYCPKDNNPGICMYNCEVCGHQFSYPENPDEQCVAARAARRIMIEVGIWRAKQRIKVPKSHKKGVSVVRLPKQYYECSQCPKYEEQKYCNTEEHCYLAPILTIERVLVGGHPWMPGNSQNVNTRNRIQSDCSPNKNKDKEKAK